MMEGDFAEVERLATDALARVPSSAAEINHFHPAVTLVYAYTEAGDLANAGRVAAEYLSRRDAWKAAEPIWAAHAVGVMIGAAARGGRMDHAEASRRLDKTFGTLVEAKTEPSTAWAAVYANASETPAEALAAIAKLDAWRLSLPTSWRGASSAPSSWRVAEASHARRSS